jgi:hypothetical protein
VRGKVHLVCTWWCMDCTVRGEPQMTQEAANKGAEEHTADTGHPTVTNYRPAR